MDITPTEKDLRETKVEERWISRTQVAGKQYEYWRSIEHRKVKTSYGFSWESWICIAAENEEGEIRIIRNGSSWYKDDLMARKLIQKAFGLPTFRKNAPKAKA